VYQVKLPVIQNLFQANFPSQVLTFSNFMSIISSNFLNNSFFPESLKYSYTEIEVSGQKSSSLNKSSTVLSKLIKSSFFSNIFASVFAVFLPTHSIQRAVKNETIV
jgi:hypothetical protein